MLSRARLSDMQEDEFRREVLLPLFQAMGFLDVVLQHGGILEQGKDFVMWKRDDLRERVNYAVVAKSGVISGQAIGRSSAAEVFFQVKQCFGRPFQDATTLEDQVVNRCIVVCSREVKKEAQHSIRSVLGPELAPHVDFIFGDKLWDLIERFMGPQTAIAKLKDAGQMMDTGSPHHRVVANVRGADVVLTLEEKYPGAALAQPVEMNATFTFPNDTAGLAAREAFERHIKTGEPVEIGPEFIQRFDLPEFLRPFLGDTIQTLKLGPAASQKSLTLDLTFESSESESRTIRALDFKMVQGGTEEITLTGKRQPYSVTLVFNNRTKQVGISVAFDLDGVNVSQAQEVISIRRLCERGGRFIIKHGASGLPLSSGNLPTDSAGDIDDRVEEFLADVVFIQSRTKVPISFPSRPILGSDLAKARNIAQMIRQGKHEHPIYSAEITLSWAGIEHVFTGHERGAIPLAGFAVLAEESEEILDIQVPLGRVARFIEGMQVDETEVCRLSDLQADMKTTDGIAVSVTPIGERGKALAVLLDHIPPEEAVLYEQRLPARKAQEPT